MIISWSSGKADEVVTLDFEEGDGQGEVVGDTVNPSQLADLESIIYKNMNTVCCGEEAASIVKLSIIQTQLFMLETSVCSYMYACSTI